MLVIPPNAGFVDRARAGIGYRFSGNGISYSVYVAGGTMNNGANLVDGNLSTQVGDSDGTNETMTWAIYNISKKLPFNTLRGYVNSATMSGATSSGGRWYDSYVEGSNDTTNGADGTWEDIGWANDAEYRSLLYMPIDTWVEYVFNTHTPYSAYRFRMTRVSQYIGLNQIELVAR